MELEQSFANIKDWLKFAETKNAALVALAGVLAPIYVGFLGETGTWKFYYGAISLPFLVAGAFLALISFLPRLDFFPASFVADSSRSLDEESDLFFEHIGRRSKDQALFRMREAFGFEEADRLKNDLATQIYAISQVTRRKMILFSWALRCVIIGIFTPAAGLAMLIIAKNDNRSHTES